MSDVVRKLAFDVEEAGNELRRAGAVVCFMQLISDEVAIDGSVVARAAECTGNYLDSAEHLLEGVSLQLKALGREDVPLS